MDFSSRNTSAHHEGGESIAEDIESSMATIHNTYVIIILHTMLPRGEVKLHKNTQRRAFFSRLKCTRTLTLISAPRSSSDTAVSKYSSSKIE